MRYLESPPSPRLRSVVRHYWSLGQSADEAADSCEPVLPDGCPELVFNLADRFRRFRSTGTFDLQPRTLFAGQMSRSILIGPSGDVDLFGIRFEPCGAYALLRTPLCELNDSIESYDAISSLLESSLRDRLLATNEFAERVATVEQVLAARCDDQYLPSDALGSVVKALETSGSSRISKFAADIGWTERKLERDFKRYVGLSPKMFARVKRFSSIVRHLETFGPENLMDRAHELGYYDQPHMIHEFHSFAGESPMAFHQRSHKLSELFTVGS